MHPSSRTLTAMLLSSLLTACGGGGGSSSETDSQLPDSSANPPDTRAYPCNTQQNAKFNQLRIYQVMVESFIDGDAGHDYHTGYGSSHHQGDLRGIINSLDYIADLGMNAIWLTPVFASIPLSDQDEWADRLDATGYFATNYFAIDPKFGSLDNAKELVEEAHKRGLYVLFDGVFGHHKSNAVDYPSPQGLSVSNGKPQSSTGNEAIYPDDLAFYQEVASYWITELKIDGWRLDQAYQVPVSAWGAIRRAVDQASASVSYQNSQGQTVHPLGYMVAEIWNNAAYIADTGYGREALPGVCSSFDFPMRYKLVESLAVNEGNKHNAIGGAWLNSGFATHNSYPDYAQPNLMLGNHDLVRFGDLLQRGKLAEPGGEQYAARHEAAYAFMSAYTGPITLYYGEEIGDQVADFAAAKNCSSDGGVGARAGLCDDHVARSSAKIAGLPPQVGEAPTELTPQQQRLRAKLRELMTLRSKTPALYAGERTHIRSDAAIYIDHKHTAEQDILFVLSTSAQSQSVTLNGSEIGSQGQLIDLLSGNPVAISGDQYQFELPAFAARFFKITLPTSSGPQPDTAGGSHSGSGVMAACDNPQQSGGPLSQPLYVVGDFADSGWKHIASRQLSYRGNNLYQAVIDEAAGGFSFQFASEQWNPQFTWQSKQVSLGEQQALENGGYDANSQVILPQAGSYVYSIQLDDAGTPISGMVSLCQ